MIEDFAKIHLVSHPVEVVGAMLMGMDSPIRLPDLIPLSPTFVAPPTPITRHASHGTSFRQLEVRDTALYR